MAIKVSGNTVIDNSRNLVGVNSITFSDSTVQSTAAPTSGGKVEHNQGDLLFTLINPNLDGNVAGEDWFGQTVLINENYIVISARRSDINGSNTGVIYVYDAKDRKLLHTLTANYFTGSQTLTAKSMDGNYVAISGKVNSVEKVWIVDLRNGEFITEIDNPNLDNINFSTDEFGEGYVRNISLKGNEVLIGAQREDDIAGADKGKAYLFNIFSGELIRSYDAASTVDGYPGFVNSGLFGYGVQLTDKYAIIYAKLGSVGPDGATAPKIWVFLRNGYIGTFPGATTDSGKAVYTIHENYQDWGNPAYGGFIANEEDDLLFVSYGLSAQPADYHIAVYKLSDGTFIKNMVPYSTTTHLSDLGDDGMAYGNGILALGAIYESALNPPADHFEADKLEGVVHLYDVDSGNLITKIYNPNSGTADGSSPYQDFFGYDLAIQGTTLLVGAYGEDYDVSGQTDNQSGIAYGFALEDIKAAYNIENITFDNGATLNMTDTIFKKAYGSGELVHRFYNPDIYRSQTRTPTGGYTDEILENDRFGFTVDVHGNYIVVGAPYDEGQPPEIGDSFGSAYVFDATTGQLLHHIPNPSSNPISNDYFGYHVRISEKYLAIGSPYMENDDQDEGLIWIFDTKSGRLKFRIEDPGATDFLNNGFGDKFELDGNILVVGCPYADGTSRVNDGKVLVYDLANTSLEAAAQGTTDLVANNLQPSITIEELSTANSYGNSALFGEEVAINGDIIAVSMPTSSGTMVNGVPNARIKFFNTFTGNEYTNAEIIPTVSPSGATQITFPHSIAMNDRYLVASQSNNQAHTLGGPHFFIYIWEIGRTGVQSQGWEPSFTLIKTLEPLDLVPSGMIANNVSEPFSSVQSLDIYEDQLVIGGVFSTQSSPHGANTYPLSAGDSTSGERIWMYDIGADKLAHTIANPDIVRSYADFETRDKFGGDPNNVRIDGNYIVVGASAQSRYIDQWDYTEDEYDNQGVVYSFAKSDLTVLDCLAQAAKS